MSAEPSPGSLFETPLAAAHVAAGARMVPFAGYLMPVQYPTGILAEHAWTRGHAGLFDVSHMGQCLLRGSDFAATAAALESLVAADIAGLQPGRQRYTQLLNEEGGIADDLMVVRPANPTEAGDLLLVVNAGTKEADYRLLASILPDTIAVQPLPDRALLALQGPEAASVLSRLALGVDALAFMDVREMTVAGHPALVSRSGYTGEDGFELSVPATAVADLWAALRSDDCVRPIGLGARDSLRLEAGLPLHGHDINQETSPVEAGLAWSIGKRRRSSGGFPGRIRIARELAEGPLRRRVGLRIEGRAPVREHAEILDVAGELVGKVTSGGFGPTIGAPIAMGYVVSEFAKAGSSLAVVLRGRTVPATVVPLPFTPHRYKR